MTYCTAKHTGLVKILLLGIQMLEKVHVTCLPVKLLRLSVTDDEITDCIQVIEKIPYIRDYRGFKVPSLVDVKSNLKCQLADAAYNIDGKKRKTTGLLLPRVFGDLFSYTEPLGAVFMEDSISLHFWAPSAQAIHASIYNDASAVDPLEIIQLEEFNGVWRFEGPRSWEGFYYVTKSLSTILPHCKLRNVSPMIRMLEDHKRALLSPVDTSIYELHVRDFSAYDQTVRPDFCGGYLAFTSQNTH